MRHPASLCSLLAAAAALAAPAAARATPANLGATVKLTAGSAAASDVVQGSDGLWWVAEHDMATTASAGAIEAVGSDGTLQGSFPTGALNAAHLAAGSDGQLWFSGDSAQIGRMTPTGQQLQAGTVSLFTVGIDAGAKVGDLAAAPGGGVWFTEPSLSKIGSIDAAGSVVTYPVGMVPDKLVAGADGAVWFTAPADGKIGRLSSSGVVTTTIAMPKNGPLTSIAGDTLHGGTLYVAETQSISVVDEATGAITGTYGLPAVGPSTKITDLVQGSDGNVWFTQDAPAGIGRLRRDGRITMLQPNLANGTTPVAIASAGSGGAMAYVAAASVGQLPIQSWVNTLGAIAPVVRPDFTLHDAASASPTSEAVAADVDAAGSPTTAHFEYGPTTAYGAQTPDVTIGQDAVASVSAVITGLSPGASYHYRLVATNGVGQSVSGDLTFTTGGVLVAPPTGSGAGPVGPSALGTLPVVTGGPMRSPVPGGTPVLDASAPVKLAASGVAKLPLRCIAGAPCLGKITVTIKLRGKATRVAAKAFSLAAGASVKLGLRISRVGIAAIRRAGRNGAAAATTVDYTTGAGGGKKTYRVVLKA